MMPALLSFKSASAIAAVLAWLLAAAVWRQAPTAAAAAGPAKSNTPHIVRSFAVAHYAAMIHCRHLEVMSSVTALLGTAMLCMSNCRMIAFPATSPAVAAGE
jgi:hypothetical protein